MAYSANYLKHPLGFYKKKDKGPQTYTPPKYEGARPYSGADVGFGAPELKTIGDQYLNQIRERSQGQGLVGFDPQHKSLLRQETISDLDDQRAEEERLATAKASSQGLRGGIPVSIAQQYAKSYGRERSRRLNQIDIADLEANREDRNTATYAQPQAVQTGAGIQQNRANFDLGEYQATQPVLIDEDQSNILPAVIGAAGTIGGAYLAGPAGAAAGGSMASAYNRSLTPRSFAGAQDPYSQYLAARRRY